MAEDAPKPWWEEDSGELQGRPTVIVDSAPQQIFVNQGMGMPDFPTTAAGVALGISIFGLVCCGPAAIASLVIAMGALEVTNTHPGHPDQGKAKAAQVISSIASVWCVVQMVPVLFG
jgi:hypothetical protein